MSDKIPNTDPTLLLPRPPRINKKAVRVILVSFAGVFLAAVIAAYSPRREKKARPGQATDETGGAVIRRPPGLTVTPDDYLPRTGREEEAAPEAVVTAPETPEYPVYDRRPRVEIRESPRQEMPDGTGTGTGAPYPPPLRGPDERRRPIFYDALPVTLTPVDTRLLAGAAETPPGYTPTFSGASFEGAYASDYQKQNMNAVKEAYLANARSADNFSGYLPSPYLPPVDVYHEIKTGTFIPVTLISSIHSDLPGPVEAQVVENVYDTYSGRNVLIPKGTRVHGDYSSSVAFGQDRVLVVWQRMTLPDGVTLDLRGMQGVDIRGMAGLADKVDYHLDKLLMAVGLSTAWDIGKAAAISALSTVDVLKEINALLTAQGSASSAIDSSTQALVIGYAEKLLNQQPTVVIREGSRGNVFVSKDIVLPRYGAY